MLLNEVKPPADATDILSSELDKNGRKFDGANLIRGRLC